MEPKEKLVRAMVEDSPNRYHGYAYGPLCTFKSTEEIDEAEKATYKDINFDEVNDEFVLDF